MIHPVAFLKAFFKDPLRTGAVAPSSRFLTRRMLAGLDFSKIRTVVELGPGTGPFTRELVRRCAPGAKIVAIELNPDFAARLRANFGASVAVENVSAERLDEVLAAHGISSPDLIVCGLAFPAMPAAVRDAIVVLVQKHCRMGAEFRMFSYVPGRIDKIFPKVRFERLGKTWLNVPPATVMTVR